jgi:ketosteroid isomerase-like protein
MVEFKNINSINEVKEVLKNFQEFYAKRNRIELEAYIENAFSTKDGLAVLGSGMNQWCYNTNDIKKLIEAHWADDNKYWRELDFKFGEAKIFADENTAWVVSIGNIRNTLTEDKQIEETMDKVKDIFSSEKKSKENVLDAVWKIASVLKQVEHGEKYVWSFRFTCVLIKEENVWKFHQMQFSLDSEGWNNRITDENNDKSIFKLSEAASQEQNEEIRKVLQVFQDGYTKRDINYVDEYMKFVFLLDEELVVIGTDAEELCLGIDAVRGIVESDWKYWGDFRLNVEDAIISVNGDVAYFTTKAILDRKVSNEKVLEWISNTAKYIFETEDMAKHKLMNILCDSLELLYENERGERYITPMRFSGVLVKKDEKWLIQHAQYSDHIDGIPGVRIFK